MFKVTIALNLHPKNNEGHFHTHDTHKLCISVQIGILIGEICTLHRQVL